MIDKSKREVKEDKVSYDETAEEIFTLNIGCPHCHKPISLSLAKLELIEQNNKQNKKEVLK